MSLLKRGGSPQTGGRPAHSSAHGSPPPQHRPALLHMGGENSAFKSLIPSNHRIDYNARSLYATDSDEEINVNDESDLEIDAGREPSFDRMRSSSLSPTGSDHSHRTAGGDHCQPLELTKHDR